jgi:hypothetical protein
MKRGHARVTVAAYRHGCDDRTMPMISADGVSRRSARCDDTCGELGIEEPTARNRSKGRVEETIECTIHGNAGSFFLLIDRIKEPDLRVLIVLLNMIGWFMLIISRINVGARLVPPISKYKIRYKIHRP